MANTNLTAAKTAKNDEFYTRLTDIEKELKHYKPHFKDKVVYCNCDDPRESNFFKYFSLNFEHLGLKKLITTGYKADGHGVIYEYNGDLNGNHIVDDEEIKVTELQGNGDFRSVECIELLKQADIVVSNPPFSLYRQYVAQLMEYGKQFIIIGNKNAITYKEIFPYIKDNKMWIGMKSMSGSLYFPTLQGAETPHDTMIDGIMHTPIACCWYTNIPHKRHNIKLDLYKKFNPNEYPKYDNYDAIEVAHTCDIPFDYQGVMGVPITFLDKYCSEQFEIVDARDYTEIDTLKNKSTMLIKDKDGAINGKPTYARILIRNRHPRLPHNPNNNL